MYTIYLKDLYFFLLFIYDYYYMYILHTKTIAIETSKRILSIVNIFFLSLFSYNRIIKILSHI